MSQLDPVAQSMTFVFTRCQARLDGADLLVTVPVTGAPVVVECEPGQRRRYDRADYASEPAYAQAQTYRFRGAVTYGRIPIAAGRWALCVQGLVRSVTGLPSWQSQDSVMIDASVADGPVNGPHLPYP